MVFPLKKCEIYQENSDITTDSNFDEGLCTAVKKMDEIDEKKKYSCSITYLNNTNYVSGSFQMHVLNNRRYPHVQIDVYYPEQNWFLLNDTDITFQNQSKISLHCKYRLRSRNLEDNYYIKWTTKILQDNPIMKGTFNESTETLITTYFHNKRASDYIGSILTLTFDRKAFIRKLNVTCTLNHILFGDKFLTSANKNIIQVYPTTLVKLLNNTNIWIPENEQVILICKADGNPAPMYQWIKKSYQTDKEDVLKSFLSELILVNISSLDGGKYVCRARNKVAPSNMWIESEEVTIRVSNSWMLTTNIVPYFLVAATILASH